jgi:hypothetical protein
MTKFWDIISRRKSVRVSQGADMVCGIYVSRTIAVSGINWRSLNLMIWRTLGFLGSGVIICDFYQIRFQQFGS